jgi:hypothetical protein
LALRIIDGSEYEIKDSPEVLEWFFEAWLKIETVDHETCNSIMQAVLGKTEFWGRDLNSISGLREKTALYLYDMITDGVPHVIKKLVDGNRL